MQTFLALPRYSFTRAVLGYAPEHPGVFGLFLGPELIYLGHTDTSYGTIKACLTSHFDGVHGGCTMEGTRYAWEVATSPAARLLNLLQQFRARNRCEPRCNEKPDT